MARIDHCPTADPHLRRKCAVCGQAQTLKALRRNGGALWRAYQLKEALRAVFAGDLDSGDVMDLLERWCSRAQRSRIPDFVKAAASS